MISRFGVGSVLGQMSLVRIFNSLSNEPKRIEIIAPSAHNFFAKGVEAVYKQSQIVATFFA